MVFTTELIRLKKLLIMLSTFVGNGPWFQIKAYTYLNGNF